MVQRLPHLILLLHLPVFVYSSRKFLVFQDTQNQCFGSGFIDSGSGSSILGWIPVRIQGSRVLNDQKLKICNFCFFDQKFVFIYAPAFAIYVFLVQHFKHEILYFCGSSFPRIRIFSTNILSFFFQHLQPNCSKLRIRLLVLHLFFLNTDMYPYPEVDSSFSKTGNKTKGGPVTVAKFIYRG